MVTVKRILLLAASAAFVAWAAPAAAERADFEGTWMHVGDRYGLLAGYVEQVDVSGDGDVSVLLFRDRSADPGCGGDARSGSCDNPQPTVRAKLTVDAADGRLAVTGREPAAPAYFRPLDQQVWDVLTFASPAPWSYEFDGDVLRLSRKAQDTGGAVDIEKSYHRVDPEMPADLYDFLNLMLLPIHRAGCAVGVIQADPEMRQAFRRLVAEVAPAAHGGDRTAGVELSEWLMLNPESNDALFPDAVPALPQIAACIEEME